jgi:hypothetical protein
VRDELCRLLLYHQGTKDSLQPAFQGKNKKRTERVDSLHRNITFFNWLSTKSNWLVQTTITTTFQQRSNGRYRFNNSMAFSLYLSGHSSVGRWSCGSSEKSLSGWRLKLRSLYLARESFELEQFNECARSSRWHTYCTCVYNLQKGGGSSVKYIFVL